MFVIDVRWIISISKIACGSLLGVILIALPRKVLSWTRCIADFFRLWTLTLICSHVGTLSFTPGYAPIP